MGYTTAMWLGFGEALATVAGALTGLLFVAVSVNGDVLATSRSLRAADGDGDELCRGRLPGHQRAGHRVHRRHGGIR